MSPRPIAPGPSSHRLQSANGKTVIDFTWTGDRFAHVIQQQNGLAEPDRLESVEGGAEDQWPDSPPIQQLSTELIDDQTMILGVGGGGTSHYSVCVRLIESGGDDVRVHFDWAVRLSKTASVPRLRTTYRGKNWSLVGDAGTIIDVDDDQATTRATAEVRPNERTVRWSYVATQPTSNEPRTCNV